MVMKINFNMIQCVVQIIEKNRNSRSFIHMVYEIPPPPLGGREPGPARARGHFAPPSN